MTTSPEPLEDDRIVAKCYLELGNVTKEHGEYDESLRYHRKSMEIYERIDDALSVADSHLNIAEVYKAKGELKQAMTEYEKGLTLYEDAFTEDNSKNSESGTDISLNSSSFSDLQHIKSISKSEKNLPQTTLNDVPEKSSPSPSPSLNSALSHSNSSLDLPVASIQRSNTLEDIPQIISTNDDSSLISPEYMPGELLRSLSTSHLSDLQYVSDNDMLLPLPPTLDLTYESTPKDNEMIEISTLPPPFFQTGFSGLNKNLEKTDHNDEQSDVQEDATSSHKKQVNVIHRLWHCLSKNQLLAITLSVLFLGAVSWSLYDTSFKTRLSCSSNQLPVHQNTCTHHQDDLSEQLRKLLIWRKDRMLSLSKENRRAIEDFITGTETRTKLTVDKFQRILEKMDLKVVLLPR